jgi:hypothetical protein
MNIKFSQFHNRNKIELKISPLLSFTNKKNPKELKSAEKEQKFFKEVFPRIFSGKKEKSKKPEEHSVPGLEKKVKGISLSVQTYNKYMGNYKNLLKYPSNHFYSTERLRNFVPYAMLKDINLNKKKNFYLTLNDFRSSQYNVNNNTNDNYSGSINVSSHVFRNNKILNQKKIISVTNYGNKDIWKVNENENYQMNDDDVFKYFIEGTFLIEPEKLQYINIDEKKIHPHLLDKNEFEFYSTYLDNLHKNENFTDNKIKEYEMCLFKGHNKSKFVLEIKSICFSFEEIDFNNNKNINNICNTLFNISPENSIININDINEDINNNYNNNNNIQRVFIVNPANYKPYKAKIQRTTSKSGKLIKVNNNIFSSYNSPKINKTSLSDENDSDDYKKDESIFAFFEDEEDKKINPSKKIDSKIKRLLPKTAKKFIEKMNEQYIFLMNEKFKKISQKLDEAKNFITEKPMIKKLFIQLLKELLLDIGISSKKFYEKLIKFTQYSKERNNFEHFMNIFDIILSENNKENLRFKFLLLLKIIESDDSNDQILDEKQINIFFDFIECDCIYIDKLCEILGEKLILRYKAIYSHENIDKSSEKKYIYRKIKIILDSFLCALDS